MVYFFRLEEELTWKGIVIKDIIKTDLAVPADKAQYLFQLLASKVKEENPVLLDFTDIRILTMAFLNIAIGELYRVEKSETLNKYISFDMDTMTNLQFSKIKMVMSNSKEKLSKKQEEEIEEVILHG